MKKWKIIIPLLFAGVFVIAGCLLFLRVHGGVKIEPAGEHAAGSRMISYRQDEELWAMDYLGASSYTMKSSGCLVTCIASAVSAQGEPVTPGELNDLFSGEGVYDGEGNIQWNRLAELDGYHVNVYHGVSEADIAQCLEEGHYPIVRVRVHGVGNYHYVLIVGAEDGEYICMDPLQDDFTKLSDYFGLVYAVRCVWREN